MQRLAIATILAAIALAAPAASQETELPYWASISAEEANMRAGAGEQFPIEWVYHRPGLPVKVIRYHQGWRLVQEPDGTEGWIFSALLSRQRGAIVTGEGLAAMRAEPGDGSRLMWNLEPVVVGKLGDCSGGWCSFDVDGHKGWVEEDRLWGDGAP